MIAALVVPSQAGAATVGAGGGTLGIGGGSESSTLTISKSGVSFVVTDSALDLSAVTGCTHTGARRVTCPSAGITKAVVVLTDGDDSLDWTGVSLPVAFYGGNGNDTATGGSGVDTFSGGAGSDAIFARDGHSEVVTCGDGSDRGTVDAVDVAAGDCEPAVERPAGAQPPAGQQPPSTGPGPAGGDPAGTGDDSAATGGDNPAGAGDDPAPIGQDDADSQTAEGDAPVAIDTPSTLVLSAGGAISVGVTCTAADGDCSGSIEIVDQDGTLKARTDVSAARRSKRSSAKKAVVLGRGEFSIHAGDTEEVTVRLSRGGRQRIIKKKKRRTRAKIFVTVKAPDGTESTSSRTVTIAPPRERRTTGRTKAPKPPKAHKPPRHRR